MVGVVGHSRPELTRKDLVVVKDLLGRLDCGALAAERDAGWRVLTSDDDILVKQWEVFLQVVYPLADRHHGTPGRRELLQAVAPVVGGNDNLRGRGEASSVSSSILSGRVAHSGRRGNPPRREQVDNGNLGSHQRGLRDVCIVDVARLGRCRQLLLDREAGAVLQVAQDPVQRADRLAKDGERLDGVLADLCPLGTLAREDIGELVEGLGGGADLEVGCG